MIIFQLMAWLLGSIIVGQILTTADRGKPRVPALELTLLCLACVPSSGLAWVGWGKLTGLTTQFGVGDSSSTALGGGYTLISADGAFGVLVGGPANETMVIGIESIGETTTTYYGLMEARRGEARRAFAVHKDDGSVRFAKSLEALGAETIDQPNLAPYHQFPGRAPTVYDGLIFAVLLLAPFAVLWRWLRSRSADGIDSEFATPRDPDTKAG